VTSGHRIPTDLALPDPLVRIVICDDNDTARAEFVRLARTHKCDVTDVEMRFAYSALLVADVQCAFVAVSLPDSIGIEVARRVRAANLHTRPLMVAIVDSFAPEDGSVLVGFDLYIERPIDPARLASLLSSLRACTH
jgi:CheY-like chemotaxis protein